MADLAKRAANIINLLSFDVFNGCIIHSDQGAHLLFFIDFLFLWPSRCGVSSPVVSGSQSSRTL